MAIDDGGEMGPAVLPTRNMGHTHRPPFITAAGSADPALYARSRGTRSLMYEPLLLPKHPIHGLLVHGSYGLPTEERLERPIAARRILLKQPTECLGPRRIGDRDASPGSRRHPMSAGPTDCEDTATPPFRDTRHAAPHASDVFRSKGYDFNASRKDVVIEH